MAYLSGLPNNNLNVLNAGDTLARVDFIYLMVTTLHGLKVNLKYDAWQKELQGSFATILAEETQQASDRKTFS